jgi:hypothetical protein
MKIFILNTPELLQPTKQTITYPTHNRHYDAEQDFLIWLKKQKNVITEDLSEADWHYLPVYWTRWHINHNFEAEGEGLPQLQEEVDKIIIDDKKTFTIALFDGGTLINVGKAIEFIGARTVNPGIDIPLICSPHRKPPIQVKKKYTASFNGSLTTHPVRLEMVEKLQDVPDVIIGGSLPTRFYKRWLWAKNYNLNIMASYISLCPRGTSCNSYRFFEAMQLGTAPCLIGDFDVRPFKKFIPWDDMSYYVSNADKLYDLLKNLDKGEALKKGKTALKYWKNELNYQKWCKYVLMELENLN